MKILISPSLDPYFNLALEEVLFEDRNESYCLFWRSVPSVVIGKNQNIFEEANIEFANKAGIYLCRRISGGGTVYHDENNINYTIIVNGMKGNFNQFDKHMDPLVKFLEGYDVKIEKSKRNDLRYQGLKISGTAQYGSRDRVLHHGTLLYDANQYNLSQSLKKNHFSYDSNAVKSVPSKITNMKQHLNLELSSEELVETLSKYFMDYFKGKMGVFSDVLIEKVVKLKKEKYSTWDWNFGFGPNFKAVYLDSFFEIEVDVKDGYIKDLIISINGKKINTDYMIGNQYSEKLILEVIVKP